KSSKHTIADKDKVLDWEVVSHVRQIIIERLTKWIMEPHWSTMLKVVAYFSNDSSVLAGFCLHNPWRVQRSNRPRDGHIGENIIEQAAFTLIQKDSIPDVVLPTTLNSHLTSKLELHLNNGLSDIESQLESLSLVERREQTGGMVKAADSRTGPLERIVVEQSVRIERLERELELELKARTSWNHFCGLYGWSWEKAVKYLLVRYHCSDEGKLTWIYVGYHSKKLDPADCDNAVKVAEGVVVHNFQEFPPAALFWNDCVIPKGVLERTLYIGAWLSVGVVVPALS
ncbi:hypothetical protein HDU99_000652, partial [Rhizoclosmatium hyalinum]